MKWFLGEIKYSRDETEPYVRLDMLGQSCLLFQKEGEEKAFYDLEENEYSAEKINVIKEIKEKKATLTNLYKNGHLQTLKRYQHLLQKGKIKVE